MREKLAEKMFEKTLVKDSLNPVPTVIPKAETTMPNVSNCDEKSMPKKVALTKIENASTKIDNVYVKASVFAIKKKDFSIKAENSEIMNKKSSAIDHKESPVEREIRITKEREEELKREREQALNSKSETDSFSSEISANETDVDSALSICSDSSFDSNNKLASLFPRTVSPETSKNDGMSIYSSSAGSMCSLDSISQREKPYSGTPLTYNGTVLSPSPDSGHFKPFKSPKLTKHIDMERFISSRGKEIKFKNDMVETTNYYELRPPQVKKGEDKTCKRFITAAEKIRKELKEMQQREEQLKKEREGLLEELKKQDNKDASGPSSCEKTPESPKNITLSDSAEGQIKDNIPKQDTDTTAAQYADNRVHVPFTDNSVIHTRRRSILIDEWEERIQKSQP